MRSMAQAGQAAGAEQEREAREAAPGGGQACRPGGS